MPDRLRLVLKLLCLGLGALVVYQLSTLVARQTSLAQLHAPSPPPGGDPLRPAAERLGTNLPPAIQARVEAITQSEILGAIIRPLPMALLGIAGQDVFLRAPNGQTALVRPGDELAGIKLLRVGTNRVVIEQDGQQKELTLFSGLGSEPLLPQERKIQ